MTKTVTETQLTLPNKRQGKVRDLYDVTLTNGDPGLLIVATDRISAFDVVLENGLPGKGVVLTQISRFWFDYFGERVNHHLISTDVADVPGLTDEEREQIEGRIMLCRRTSVLPVECIVRGYITGSGYKDYMRSGKVCGIDLPTGLKNSDRLSEPLFTPFDKSRSRSSRREHILRRRALRLLAEKPCLGCATLHLISTRRRAHMLGNAELFLLIQSSSSV